MMSNPIFMSVQNGFDGKPAYHMSADFTKALDQKWIETPYSLNMSQSEIKSDLESLNPGYEVIFPEA